MTRVLKQLCVIIFIIKNPTKMTFFINVCIRMQFLPPIVVSQKKKRKEDCQFHQESRTRIVYLKKKNYYFSEKNCFEIQILK